MVSQGCFASGEAQDGFFVVRGDLSINELRRLKDSLRADFGAKLSDVDVIDLARRAVEGIESHGAATDRTDAALAVVRKLKELLDEHGGPQVVNFLKCSQRCLDFAVEIYASGHLDGQDVSWIFHDINAGLREACEIDKWDVEHVAEFIGKHGGNLAPFALLLFEALKHLTPAKTPGPGRFVTVYRGLRMKKAVLERYKRAVGRGVLLPAFTSCTVDEAGAVRFPTDLNPPADDEIDVTLRVEVGDAPRLRGLADPNNASEHEVLLHPGWVLVLVAVSEEGEIEGEEGGEEALMRTVIDFKDVEIGTLRIVRALPHRPPSPRAPGESGEALPGAALLGAECMASLRSSMTRSRSAARPKGRPRGRPRAKLTPQGRDWLEQAERKVAEEAERRMMEAAERARQRDEELRALRLRVDDRAMLAAEMEVREADNRVREVVRAMRRFRRR